MFQFSDGTSKKLSECSMHHICWPSPIVQKKPTLCVETMPGVELLPQFFNDDIEFLQFHWTSWCLQQVPADRSTHRGWQNDRQIRLEMSCRAIICLSTAFCCLTWLWCDVMWYDMIWYDMISEDHVYTLLATWLQRPACFPALLAGSTA